MFLENYLKSQKKKSSPKWSLFFLEKDTGRGSTEISVRTISLSHIYK